MYLINWLDGGQLQYVLIKSIYPSLLFFRLLPKSNIDVINRGFSMYPSLYNSVIPKMLSIAHGYERENESSLIVTDATQQIVNDFCRRSMGGKNKANAIEWFYFVPLRSVIFKWTIATHPRDETRFGFREYPLPVVFALFPASKSKPRTFHASTDESSNFFFLHSFIFSVFFLWLFLFR